MATDSTILLAKLHNYQQALDRHLAQLQSDFQQIDRQWASFSAVYAGKAAEQFRSGWTATTERFKEYLDRTQRIRRLLQERIDYLQQADQEETGLL